MRFSGSAQAQFAGVPEAFAFAFGLPPILGLSPTGGFQFMLEDRAGGDIARTWQGCRRAGECRATAAGAGQRDQHIPSQRSRLTRSTMDNDKLQTLGVPLTDAYNTLQTFLGGLYVNDFNLFGRVWQVLVQAEPVLSQ